MVANRAEQDLVQTGCFSTVRYHVETSGLAHANGHSKLARVAAAMS
jgi:hypothetical protein